MPKIFCYTKKIKNFPSEHINKIEIINPLVRQKIYKINRTSSNDDKFNILVVGGSQGARIFDNELKKSLLTFQKISNTSLSSN